MKRILLIPAMVLAFAPALHAQVRNTPAVIGLVQGGNPQGFIQGSNDEGITFSTSESSRGNFIEFTKIRGEGLDKAIRLDERAEALAEARNLYASGDYRAAAQVFGGVARDYALVLGIPRNFATEAVFYQLDSLRRAGRFAEMAEVLATPAGRSIKTKLGEPYRERIPLLELWGLYGSGDMGALETALADYQRPVVGNEELLPTPILDPMPPNEAIQIAFLRAKVYDARDEKDKALLDYYRVFTLTYANEPFLAKQAMGAAMVIQRQDPAVDAEGENRIKGEMQGIAYTFSKLYGDSIMPEAFRKFAERPKMAAPEGGGEAPAPEEGGAGASAKGGEKGGEKGAPKGKAEPKGKGKGKGKG